MCQCGRSKLTWARVICLHLYIYVPITYDTEEWQCNATEYTYLDRNDIRFGCRCDKFRLNNPNQWNKLHSIVRSWQHIWIALYFLGWRIAVDRCKWASIKESSPESGTVHSQTLCNKFTCEESTYGDFSIECSETCSRHNSARNLTDCLFINSTSVRKYLLFLSCMSKKCRIYCSCICTINFG